jgi:hypothetical protein
VPLEVLAEGSIVRALQDVQQGPDLSVAVGLDLQLTRMLLLPRVLLGNGVEGPVGHLQTVADVEPLEIYFDILVHPYFFKHSMQFLLYVNIVLQTQLYLLLALQHLLVLVLEEDGAEVVELGHEGDEISMLLYLEVLEEEGQD